MTEAVNKYLTWLNVGLLVMTVVLGAFAVLVFGTSWLADAIPTAFGMMPRFIRNMLPFVAVAAIAILIGRYFTRRAENNDE